MGSGSFNQPAAAHAVARGWHRSPALQPGALTLAADPQRSLPVRRFGFSPRGSSTALYPPGPRARRAGWQVARLVLAVLHGRGFPDIVNTVFQLKPAIHMSSSR